MKFVSSLKISDRAYQLYLIQEERKALQAKVRDLVAQEAALSEFLEARAGESFQFADKSGFLMELDINGRSRQDIDGEAVRRFYAKMGKKVPMKVSEWTEVKAKYILEK